MVHYKICPLCSSEKISLYLETNDFFLTSEPFSLFRCSDCGFVFTQDHPDEKDIGRYYKSVEYLSHNDSVKGFSGRLYRASRKIMLITKRKLITRATGIKKGNLLDIGSGTGHFIREMKEAGWQVSGIEIDEKVRLHSESSFNLKVHSPDEIQSLPSGSYDCITMWHVLEHFQYPFKYALEIKRLLKPDGICLVALPNRFSFDAEHYRKFWAAYDVPRHLWHFSPFTFRLFAEKTGFRIIHTGSLPLDVFYISMLSEKYCGAKLHLIAGLITGKWFWFLSSFNIEKRSSLYYILKAES